MRRSPLRRLSAAASLSIALGLPLLAGCEEKITSANYDKIHTGMTLGEVEHILGKGEKQEVGGMSITGAGIATGAGSNRLSTYVWKTPGKEISVTFDNDKVVSMGKSGL